MAEVVSCIECGSDDLIVCPQCQEVVTHFCLNHLSAEDLDELAELECFGCFKPVCPVCGPCVIDWLNSLNAGERKWARYGILKIAAIDDLERFDFGQPICGDCRRSVLQIDKRLGYLGLCERCGGIIPPNDEYEIESPFFRLRLFHVTQDECWPGSYWENRELTASIVRSVEEELAQDPELVEDAILRRHIREALGRR